MGCISVWNNKEKNNLIVIIVAGTCVHAYLLKRKKVILKYTYNKSVGFKIDFATSQRFKTYIRLLRISVHAYLVHLCLEPKFILKYTCYEIIYTT